MNNLRPVDAEFCKTVIRACDKRCAARRNFRPNIRYNRIVNPYARPRPVVARPVVPIVNPYARPRLVVARPVVPIVNPYARTRKPNTASLPSARVDRRLITAYTNPYASSNMKAKMRQQLATAAAGVQRTLDIRNAAASSIGRNIRKYVQRKRANDLAMAQEMLAMPPYVVPAPPVRGVLRRTARRRTMTPLGIWTYGPPVAPKRMRQTTISDTLPFMEGEPPSKRRRS